MKIFSLTLILSCLIAYKANAQDSIGNNRQEKRVLKLINSLPEIISGNKQRSPQRLMHAYIEDIPTSKIRFYEVSVCDNFAGRLFTYYRFRVYLPDYGIYYDDLDNGKLVPLKLWHKQPYGVYSK